MKNLPSPLTTKPTIATTITCRPITKEATRTNDKLSWISSHGTNGTNNGEGQMKTSLDEK